MDPEEKIMPKVSEEYIANKRKSIVDAAHRLCLVKPVSTVTMTDLINETGMAQGGIYRYFKDIDEVFSAMLLDLRESYSIKDGVDEIFAGSDKRPLGDSIDMICDLLADSMEKELMDIQKINFDLSVMAINEPERTTKILGGIKGEGNLEHLISKTGELLEKAAKKGDLKPVMPVEDIMKFISSAYSGIQMNCIIGACYRTSPMGGYEPRPLFKTLAQTIRFLFGES